MSDQEHDSDPEPLSDHEELEEHFKPDPEEEKKYADERRKALELKLQAEEEEKKVQLERKKQLKIAQLTKKVKKYDDMSNKEEELGQISRKYSEDRLSRARYYFYKKELLVKKLNMMNEIEINNHIDNNPCTTEEKIKLIEFELQIKNAFINKNNKGMVKHMNTKKYIR